MIHSTGSVWIGLAGFASLALALNDSIPEKIRQLGSDSFEKRQAATKWFLERPETLPALKEALGSANLELKRRAASILDEFDRRPLKELSAAIENGSIDRAIELFAHWPKGKHEEAVWTLALGLVKKLSDLHKRNGGNKDTMFPAPEGAVLPIVLAAKRVTETTEDMTTRKGFPFIRAGEVDLNGPKMAPSKLIFASGPVRLRGGISGENGIFALGPVHLKDFGFITCTVIVSSSDVTIDDELVHSLIIAKGKVTCTKGIYKSQIISGKAVIHDKRYVRDSMISEDEPNPLGYVRFSNVPEQTEEIEQPKKRK
ncbi:MAG: hypothetical protein L0215_05285 [Gemmataceae bacterium]|nr:hypothetical protein [Gemmataceae bacterium]